MNKIDYSNDVNNLMPYEIYEYDSIDEHETEINDGRMRLPNRYDIEKKYKRYKVNRGNRRNRRNRRKGEYGNWVEKDEDEKLDFAKDFEWQVTYKFPSSLHVTNYGSKNMTYRRLYLILCEHFNGGEYFIDTYFDEVYPYTIKHEVDKSLEKIKEDLLDTANFMLKGAVATKKGKLDKRNKANIGMEEVLREYESFAQEWENGESVILANMIKEDIIESLASKKITLNHRNTTETKKVRAKLSLDREPEFYATHTLIEGIQLFISIGGNKKWRTNQGILV